MVFNGSPSWWSPKRSVSIKFPTRTRPDRTGEWSETRAIYVPLTVLDGDAIENSSEPPTFQAFRGAAFAVTGPSDARILDASRRLEFPDDFPSHRNRFAWLRRGADHPNEIAAYILPYLDPVLAKAATNGDRAIVQRSSELLAEALQLGPENLPVPPPSSSSE